MVERLKHGSPYITLLGHLNKYHCYGLSGKKC